METLKDFIKNLKSLYNDAIERGDVMLANDITANVMTGSIMILISLLSVLCLGLNEFRIFTADRVSMRFGVLLSLAIEIPVVTLNRIYHGKRAWLKYVLLYSLAVQSTLLTAFLGHNAVLVSVLPMLISIRYCNQKLTKHVSIVTIILTTAASVYCGFFGVINLNAVKITDEVLTVQNSLRDAILTVVDRKNYTMQMLINDYLPRLITLSLIAVISTAISGYGRKMVFTQSKVSEKSARIDTELSLAQKIQASMLPCIFPPFKEFRKLELYAMNRPAKEVGGDFYDYFQIDGNHVGFVMADVSGKGIGAALFMTISKTIIKNYMTALTSPAEAISAANEEICENNEVGLFVTVWAGILEMSTGKLIYTNAGHNPPLLIRKGQEAEWLHNRHGFVVGGMADLKYTESEIQLNDGDEIFLYTDGVTEAMDASLQLYGEERLYHCLNRNANLEVKSQLENVMLNLEDFTGGVEQFDDITMMNIRIVE